MPTTDEYAEELEPAEELIHAVQRAAEHAVAERLGDLARAHDHLRDRLDALEAHHPHAADALGIQAAQVAAAGRLEWLERQLSSTASRHAEEVGPLAPRLERLERQHTDRLDAHGRRLTALEDNLGPRIERLEHRVDDLREAGIQTAEALAELPEPATASGLEAALDRLERRLEHAEGRIAALVDADVPRVLADLSDAMSRHVRGLELRLHALEEVDHAGVLAGTMLAHDADEDAHAAAFAARHVPPELRQLLEAARAASVGAGRLDAYTPTRAELMALADAVEAVDARGWLA